MGRELSIPSPRAIEVALDLDAQPPPSAPLTSDPHMTLDAAQSLALTKLVTLLETLTDPAEIRRVATAILRIKPPKQPVPPDVDRRETAGAEVPVAPTVPLHRGDHPTPTSPLPPTAARAMPSDVKRSNHISTVELPRAHTTPAAHLLAIAGTTHARNCSMPCPSPIAIDG